MEQYKVTYNYKETDTFEDITHWLIGCEIVEAEDELKAQKIFIDKHPNIVIRDIELLG